jgi:hypothetical protein
MHHSAFEGFLVWYVRRFPIRHRKLRVINLFWQAAAGNQDTLRLAHLVHGGLTMRCDVSEMLQRQFYFFGTYFLAKTISDGRPRRRVPRLSSTWSECRNLQRAATKCSYAGNIALGCGTRRADESIL